MPEAKCRTRHRALTRPVLQRAERRGNCCGLAQAWQLPDGRRGWSKEELDKEKKGGDLKEKINYAL